MQLRRPLASTLGLKLVINHSQPFRIVFLQCRPIPWALSLITTPLPQVSNSGETAQPRSVLPARPTWKGVLTFTACASRWPVLPQLWSSLPARSG